jgi:hypothetical protein
MSEENFKQEKKIKRDANGNVIEDTETKSESK